MTMASDWVEKTDWENDYYPIRTVFIVEEEHPEGHGQKRWTKRAIRGRVKDQR